MAVTLQLWADTPFLWNLKRKSIEPFSNRNFSKISNSNATLRNPSLQINNPVVSALKINFYVLPSSRMRPAVFNSAIKALKLLTSTYIYLSGY